MAKMNLRDLSVAGKRVFVRVDFNVPIKEGSVSDDTRIQASLPTIKHLIDAKAKVVLASHLGRPKGQRKPEMSLAPVGNRLAELLGSPVAFAEDCIGDPVEAALGRLEPGQVLLLENLRFHAEETANDPAFAEKMAKPYELYVNDAFGSAHRAHASTEGVTRFLSPCAGGFLMEKELEYLGSALENPARPFVAILGGAKVSGKIEVIENLIPKVDTLLIGGAMMFTFLRVQGFNTGGSLVEDETIPVAAKVLEQAKSKGTDLRLPLDCRVSESIEGTDPGTVAPVSRIPDDRVGVDIGPETIENYAEAIRKAGTVVWNGPMGVFEVPAFAEGTNGVAHALVDATSRGAVTIVGGGDSAAAIKKAGLAYKVSHVSTGGGASLEFLEGKELPGVAALTDRGA